MRSKTSAAMLLVAVSLALAGCGQGEIEDEVVQEVISIVQEPEYETVVTPKKFDKYGYEELRDMPLEGFRDLIERTYPGESYRAYFRIEDGYVLTDEDWEVLRDIVLMEHYGKDRMLESIQIGLDDYDPNWIYTEPTSEYILSLDADGFRAYLKGMSEYFYPGEDATAYGELSDEDAIALRDSFAAECEGK